MITPEEAEELKQLGIEEVFALCLGLGMDRRDTDKFTGAASNFYDAVGEIMMVPDEELLNSFYDSDMRESVNSIVDYLLFLSGLLVMATKDDEIFNTVSIKLKIALSGGLIWTQRAAYAEGYRDAQLNASGFDSFLDDMNFEGDDE